MNKYPYSADFSPDHKPTKKHSDYKYQHIQFTNEKNVEIVLRENFAEIYYL